MSDDIVVFSSSSSSTSHPQQHSNSQTTKSCIKTIAKSIRIFFKNKKLFFTIFALTTLPLSLLIFSLTFIATPTRAHIINLETHVARLSSTRLEAMHVYQESRSDAVALLHVKALFFLPCYLLSLLAAVTSVESTSLAFNNKNPSVHSAINAVKNAWKRPLLTAMYGYIIMLLYVQVPFFVAAIVREPVLRFLVLVVGSGFEVYMMGVVSFGLVVSVLEEERFGLGAIWVGSGLIRGRWVFGWVLMFGFGVLTGWIGWSMERIMDRKKNVVSLMSDWRVLGFVGLYGTVIILGFVVVTVFYCESRTVSYGNFAIKNDESETETVTI